MSLEYTDCALQSVWWLCIPTTASCNLHGGFVTLQWFPATCAMAL